MATESETKEAKMGGGWKETRTNLSEENITNEMIPDVMEKRVNKRSKVVTPGSKREKEKAGKGHKEKHADVRHKKKLAKAVVSEMTARATNKADEIDRMVASKPDGIAKVVVSKIEGEKDKEKRKLAKSVVSKLENTAINERCVSKVIDSLANIGKIELIELGRFNVPAFLSMTASHQLMQNQRTNFVSFTPISDRSNRSRWRASDHIRC